VFSPAFGSSRSTRAAPVSVVVGTDPGVGSGFSPHPPSTLSTIPRIPAVINRFMAATMAHAWLHQCRLESPPHVGRRTKRKWRSPCEPRHSCSSFYVRIRSSVKQLRRSVHRLDSITRVAFSLRASLCGLWRPETRPNQRLNVPLDHLLSVAVGFMSAPAAHPSLCAPNPVSPQCRKLWLA
jgi:hypothetical protein